MACRQKDKAGQSWLVRLSTHMPKTRARSSAGFARHERRGSPVNNNSVVWFSSTKKDRVTTSFNKNCLLIFETVFQSLLLEWIPKSVQNSARRIDIERYFSEKNLQQKRKGKNKFSLNSFHKF